MSYFYTSSVWQDLNAARYLSDNSSFDKALALKAWRFMLPADIELTSAFEYGCHIGRNLDYLTSLFPGLSTSGFDIYKQALDQASLNPSLSTSNLIHADLYGFIQDHSPSLPQPDLVFTCSFLNALPHSDSLAALHSLYKLSSRYILIVEYHSRKPSAVSYREFGDVVFKADYARILLNLYGSKLEILHHGFLWGHLYDEAGYDDMNFTLFEKNNTQHSSHSQS